MADFEQTTSLADPRVIATYRFRASNSSAFKTTTTSASSPFSSRVLPTARFGSGRPINRFFSLSRTTASWKVLPGVPSAVRNAVMHDRRTAGRCTRTPCCLFISTSKFSAAVRLGAAQNSSADFSTSFGGLCAVPARSEATRLINSGPPKLVIISAENSTSSENAEAELKSNRAANATRSLRSTLSTTTAPGV